MPGTLTGPANSLVSVIAGSGGQLLLILAGAAFARQVASPPEIYLGGRLTLGMPEADVLKILADLYNLQKAPGGEAGEFSSWVLMSKTGPPSRSYGNVAFQRGRLASVIKYWGPDDQRKGLEFGTAVSGVIAGLVREGNAECRLYANTGDDPGWARKAAFITCGRKEIAITVTRSSEYGDFASVNETLK